MNKSRLNAVLTSVLDFSSFGSQAVMLQAGDTLRIAAKMPSYDQYDNLANVTSGL